MIVSISHRTGAELRTEIVGSGERPPARDVARALLGLLDDVSRVRVWVDGWSFRDVPSADEWAANPSTDLPLLAARAMAVRLKWLWRPELTALRMREFEPTADLGAPEWFQELREHATQVGPGVWFFPRPNRARRLIRAARP